MKRLTNIGASVRQRLLNIAKESGRPFNVLAQHYALERWLYRLSRSQHRDDFILKGALMLLVWELPYSRPTRDIDLLGQLSNDLEAIKMAIASICTVSVEEDGMSFDSTSIKTEHIAEDADYHGVRATFTALLGSAKLPMQIDIGFSDVVSPAPCNLTYPTLLSYPAPALIGYNQETAIAEKFQAMVKLGQLNSRMKDFFDICLLALTRDFVGATLADALRSTFQKRSTSLVAHPSCLSGEFAVLKQPQWNAFSKRIGATIVPARFSEVLDIMANFMGHGFSHAPLTPYEQRLTQPK